MDPGAGGLPGTGAKDSSAEEGPGGGSPTRYRIQVSRDKRPLSFFINLAKKFLQKQEEVELSGLGLAVTSVVTIAEIMRQAGFVTVTHIQTSLVPAKSDERTNQHPKAKIQIWIRRTEYFFELLDQKS